MCTVPTAPHMCWTPRGPLALTLRKLSTAAQPPKRQAAGVAGFLGSTGLCIHGDAFKVSMRGIPLHACVSTNVSLQGDARAHSMYQHEARNTLSH